MTPDNYMKNGDFTKHPLKTCSLEASKTLEPESQPVFFVDGNGDLQAMVMI